MQPAYNRARARWRALPLASPSGLMVTNADVHFLHGAALQTSDQNNELFLQKLQERIRRSEQQAPSRHPL